MRTIAPALALLVGALSVLVADNAAAVERLSDDVLASGRPLTLSGRGNEAVLALLEQAERELDAGRPDQAAVVLERALRIDPSNPTVWHYLGLARLDVGDYAQAETMASRSHSLAPADRALRNRNAKLVATARQASGRTAGPMPNGLDTLAPLEEEQQASWRLLPNRIETWPSRSTLVPQTAPPSSYVDAGDRRARSGRGQQRVDRAVTEPRERGEPTESAPTWRARRERRGPRWARIRSATHRVPNLVQGSPRQPPASTHLLR